MNFVKKLVALLIVTSIMTPAVFGIDFASLLTSVKSHFTAEIPKSPEVSTLNYTNVAKGAAVIALLGVTVYGLKKAYDKYKASRVQKNVVSESKPEVEQPKPISLNNHAVQVKIDHAAQVKIDKVKAAKLAKEVQEQRSKIVRKS